MRIITIEDFRDIYLKIMQRGRKFVFSKFNLSEKSRTKSSFNVEHIDSSNWWDIPLVKKRWNYMITGSPDLSYEAYVSRKYAEERIKMLSIGSGICSHEMEFARLNPHWEVTCLDFSDKLLHAAEKTADARGLKNMKFLVADIYQYELPSNYYHIVMFHSSLHHFKQLESFLDRIVETLAPAGKLMINEYVGANRLQYSRMQLNAINRCLALIEKKYRQIYKTRLHKRRYYGSGVLRMIISDPSECIESEKILPEIHRRFKTIEEKGYGGNLLMPVLKDISHHFTNPDENQKRCLQRIFDLEDDYLMKNRSDFVFGIYEKTS